MLPHVSGRINREWLLTNIVGDVTEIIVFAVAGEAEVEATTSCGGPTGAGAFHGEADYVKALCQIGAVRLHSLRSRNRGRDQPGWRRQTRDRSEWNKRNDYWSRPPPSGTFFDRGDVHSFMGAPVCIPLPQLSLAL